MNNKYRTYYKYLMENNWFGMHFYCACISGVSFWVYFFCSAPQREHIEYTKTAEYNSDMQERWKMLTPPTKDLISICEKMVVFLLLLSVTSVERKKNCVWQKRIRTMSSKWNNKLHMQVLPPSPPKSYRVRKREKRKRVRGGGGTSNRAEMWLKHRFLEPCFNGIRWSEWNKKQTTEQRRKNVTKEEKKVYGTLDESRMPDETMACMWKRIGKRES